MKLVHVGVREGFSQSHVTGRYIILLDEKEEIINPILISCKNTITNIIKLPPHQIGHRGFLLGMIITIKLKKIYLGYQIIALINTIFI